MEARAVGHCLWYKVVSTQFRTFFPQHCTVEEAHLIDSIICDLRLFLVFAQHLPSPFGSVKCFSYLIPIIIFWKTRTTFAQDSYTTFVRTVQFPSFLKHKTSPIYMFHCAHFFPTLLTLLSARVPFRTNIPYFIHSHLTTRKGFAFALPQTHKKEYSILASLFTDKMCELGMYFRIR